jgi:hypothetical protein
MRKFGFIAVAALIALCFGGWIASNNTRVASPAITTATIAPMQMMTASPNLPAQHFVDYSLVYSD